MSTRVNCRNVKEICTLSVRLLYLRTVSSTNELAYRPRRVTRHSSTEAADRDRKSQTLPDKYPAGEIVYSA